MAAAAGSRGRQARQRDPLIGRTVGGKYLILGLLGRGGMGKVYRASQEPGGRPVAVKLLSPNFPEEEDPNFVDRFMLEANAAAKLHNANNITIYDFGSEGETFYIAMELLHGRPLSSVLRKEGRLPVGRVLHIGKQICRALREAHQLGIVHRDIKPSNVFLTKHDDDEDFVKVLDFGLVKFMDQDSDLTKSGMFVGSPKYMPPEQIRKSRGKADARSDVYALGVLLYHMLSGRVPFDGDPVDVLVQHLHDKPPPMTQGNPGLLIPARLEKLVMKCLAKYSQDRCQSIDELLTGLRAVEMELFGESSGSSEHFVGVSQPMPPPALPAASKEPAPSGRRPGWLVPSVVGAGILLAAGLGAVTLLGTEPEKAPPPAGRSGRLTTALAPVTAAGQPHVPAEPAPATRIVTVDLRTNPPGAEVFEGEELVGITPVVETWELPPAEAERKRNFEFHMKGRKPVKITMRPVDGSLRATVSLKRTKPPAATASDSYKGDPY